MAFAAAAVVGARNGARNHPVSRTVGKSEHVITKGPNVATGIATCACTILLTAGMTSVVRSFSNERSQLVMEYDENVKAWVDHFRAEFAASTLNVTATIEREGSPSTSHALHLQVSNDSDFYFHDAEQEKGLSGYTPLRFVGDLHFPSYYPPQNTTGIWEALPAKEEAAQVTFHFDVRNETDHSVSHFSTQPWPLAYDEIVRSRTPAPENKCRREQKGVWRLRRCHVVKSLNKVCLQVGRNQATGEWELHSKENSSLYTDSHRSAVGGHGTAPYVPVTLESFGCDPISNWHPATYHIDPCWAERSVNGGCEKSFESHTVSITVRSFHDPYIRAEELTQDTFNFGLSPRSQRVYGFTMMAVGLCLCIVPLVRLRVACKDRRKLKSSDDDTTSFKKYGPDDEDVRPAGVEKNVYGSRSL